MKFAYSGFLIISALPVLLFALIHKKMMKERLKFPLFPKFLLVQAAMFMVLDSIAIRSGWWSINDRYSMDIYLGNVPIEELFFFIIVPWLCLFVWTLIRVEHPIVNIADMFAHHFKAKK